MSGEFVDDSGRAHRVVIDIRCDASRLGNFARTGQAAITGTARAEPWADGVAIRTPDEILNEWLAAGFPDDFRPLPGPGRARTRCDHR